MPGQLPDGRRDGLRPARADREHENRQVGPGKLASEDLGELVDRAGSERLLGQQERAGAALDLVAELRRIRARDGRDPGRREDPDGELSVAPARCEDEDPQVGAGGTVAGSIDQRSPLADRASTFPRN